MAGHDDHHCGDRESGCFGGKTCKCLCLFCSASECRGCGYCEALEEAGQ